MCKAEHDVVAAPMLVTTCEELVEKVEKELEIQLSKLSTKETVIIRAGCMTYPHFNTSGKRLLKTRWNGGRL